VIEAQKALVELNLLHFDKLSKSDREKTHRSLTSQAYPDSFFEKKALSAEHLQRLLQGR